MRFDQVLSAASLVLLYPTLMASSACSEAPPPAKAPQIARLEISPDDCVEQKDIERVLAARKHGFLSCYADAVALEPTLKGTVTIAFVIPPSGKVDHVDITDSDLDSDALHTCITRAASGMEFTQEHCSLPRDIEYSVRLRRDSSEFVSSSK